MTTAATSPAAGAPPRHHRLITGLGIGQICSWGSLYYAFPQIADAMARDLGHGKPALYGAASVGLLAAGLAAIPVGTAVDRGHGRAVMAGGAALAGLLLFVWSGIDSLMALYLILAGLGVMQAATLYEPAFAVVARRTGPLQARRGITALTLWGGFASTVFIPLIQLLLDHLGWRNTLVVLGLINLLVSAPLYAWVIDRRGRAGPGAAPARPAAMASGTAGGGALRLALRRPVFWALALSFTAYAAVFSAFTFHLYPLLAERGFATTAIVTAMAIIGPAQVAGRIAIWVLAPRASVRLIGMGVVAVFPAALLLLWLAPPGFWAIAVVAVLYGAANGIMTIVRGLAVPEMIGPEAYGAVNGALTAPSLIAKALAPAGAAMLWGMGQSYDTVMPVLTAGSVLIAAGFWIAAVIGRPGRRLT
ncbi:putative transporter, MFS family protein [Tistrella bauzanensis]|uniref:Transporter, MFS family protein n=1 Tax=Tistrella bauzanensis TaxID=657419 RepID=A0ABQ1IS65_9PROT|nr:MFS transporter [Tistrella bauzanensis]GGB51221.1 putative transporter, MFS family protein [Tistrella bauzanensis]